MLPLCDKAANRGAASGMSVFPIPGCIPASAPSVFYNTG